MPNANLLKPIKRPYWVGILSIYFKDICDNVELEDIPKVKLKVIM